MAKMLKLSMECCRKHIASSLILTATISWFIGWGLSWIVPSPSVAVDNFPQKELTCTLNSGFPLILQITEDEDFQILFKDKEIKEPWVYNITIENTGEQPILNEDFAKPLSIDFEESAGVIKATIIEASNRDLWNEFLEKSSIDGTVLSIQNILLNQGESITFNVFTEAAAGNINYDQRTVGLSELILKNVVKESNEQLASLKKWMTIGVIVFAVIMTVLIIYLVSAMVISHKSQLEFDKKLQKYYEKMESLATEETQNEPECQCK